MCNATCLLDVSQAGRKPPSFAPPDKAACHNQSLLNRQAGRRRLMQKEGG